MISETRRRPTVELDAASDVRLVELARARDEGAIRAIIKRNNQRLFRAARAITRNDAEAEDVVQASYMKAFTHLEGFRGDARLSTWLTRIAVNEALGRLRGRHPTAGLEQIDIEAPTSAQIIQFPGLQFGSDPETEMSRQDVRQFLEAAVDALPAGFRAVFVLRDIEGLSVEETATSLEIKPETVSTRLHRARHMMRERLEAQLTDAFDALFPFDGERCMHIADSLIAKLGLGVSQG